MREIKFRAWDKDNKKMYCFDLFNYMNINENEQEKLCPCTPFHIKQTLMQYTGLKDKNGKEIYEGDILKVFMDGYLQEHPSIVEWDEIGWQPFLMGEKDKYYYIDECEVIGNICENPELKS